MSEPVSASAPEPADGGRAEILRRVRTSMDDGVSVVNSVLVSDLPEGSAGPPRRRRRRRRTPPTARVDFTAWAAIPWRDRPGEARLADVAHAIGQAIERSPAWRHDLLDTHHVRLAPARDAAEIAYAAYRLYGSRAELGARPEGPDNPVLTQAQALYDEHFSALTIAWLSLVDRAAALSSYQEHLAELAPILAALSDVRRLEGVELDRDMSALFADTVRNELATEDTRDLRDRVDAAGDAVIAVIGLLSSDVQAVTALGRREVPWAAGRRDPSAALRP